MSQTEILQNTFEPRALKSILKHIDFVSFDQAPENVMKEIEELSPDEYLWAVGSNPAYFVQYQVKSAAIIKVKNMVLIVWIPKHIEYPSLIKFPELKQKKPANLKISIIEGESTTSAATNQAMIEFLSCFYGTYFYSDKQFQTNLVTYAKHFISRVTRHSYWHAILDDNDKLFVTQRSKMGNVCKFRLTGMKEGYDKTLLLFSYQGTRSSFIRTAKNKWMQILSFVAMIIIFYSIVACNADSTEGICAYRQELTLSGAGIMLALIGLRYGQKKRQKKNGTNKGRVSATAEANKED